MGFYLGGLNYHSWPCLATTCSFTTSKPGGCLNAGDSKYLQRMKIGNVFAEAVDIVKGILLQVETKTIDAMRLFRQQTCRTPAIEHTRMLQVNVGDLGAPCKKMRVGKP